MADIDPAALEGRLVTIEQSMRSGFEGVHQRLDRLNGQVARNTSWRIDHQQQHATETAYDAGEAAGRIAITRRTVAILGVVGTLLMVGATTAAQVIVTRALGG